LALSALLNLDPPKSIEMDEYYIYLNYDNKKTKKLPINSESTINSYIRWYKPLTNKNLSAHQQYSAWKIIRSYENIKQNKMPLINPDEFKGKIVVVGATATVLHDIKTTSIGSNYPGVDIQTTYIDNILNDYTMAQAPVIVNILGLILAVGLTLFLIIRLIPIYSFISTLILMFLYLYLAMYYHSQGFAIDLVTPYLFMVLTLIIGYAYRYSREDRTKTKIKTAMEKYVSKNIVTKVIKDTDEIELGGEKAEITVLFADIRGFTGISEDLPPEIVTDLLNEYFRVMLPVIEKYNGVLNKFMGDAILAIFGDPIKDDKHPENAIRCADEMIKEVFKIRERWKKEGKPKIDIGIGINTGIAFIGNVGTQERLEYTVIGDTVNVANRIEAQNKIYNTKLLISETTYQRVKDFVDTIKISSVEIRGREKLINIYEIIKLLDDE